MVEKKHQPLPSFAELAPHVRQSVIPKRPFMGDFIQYACDHLMDYRVMFSNADILFDSSIGYFTMMSDKVFDSTFYAITRWYKHETEGMTPNPFQWGGSYDTFVFKPRSICTNQTALQDLVSNLDFHLGVMGMENRLLWEVRRQYPEMRLINPLWQVKTVHNHASPERSAEWAKRVDSGGKSIVISWEYMV
ncbi:hypothetical protein BC939DRAFT_434318 [Gamsiella multidivaricata]|uniref:uncharacterized protein n=1 Tax=Gamsiella multidivaricata TaxID=101098 RepID=UPI00221F83A9|nr:uncharacterized protein BC939DRAFT_434318 [Gamsiella multidivaricata]KAI7832772.1 hypothetical protein BC939DRAFT_434318 [Gamsiella multidivaricata]